MGSYGTFIPRVPFDSMLVISEIVVMSSAFYAAFSFIDLLFCIIFKIPFQTSFLFDFRYTNISTAIGRINLVSYLISGTLSGITFFLIMERPWKSLDFVSTNFVVHLVISSSLYKFPTSITWWAITLLSCFIGTFLAVILTTNKEMKDIDLETELQRNNI